LLSPYFSHFSSSHSIFFFFFFFLPIFQLFKLSLIPTSPPGDCTLKTHFEKPMSESQFAAAFDPKHKRRLFTAEEDTLLCLAVHDRRLTTWIEIAARIPGRTARQCRDRWANYLCPQNKNAAWTSDEDDLLLAKFSELGAHWSAIAKFFDGRSENNVKNRWYTHVRQRLTHETVSDPIVSHAGMRQLFPSIAALSPELMLSSLLSPQDLTQVMVGSPIHPSVACFTSA
jgi:hypothetical protein